MNTQARRQEPQRRYGEVPMSLRGMLICLLIALSLAAPAAAAVPRDTTTGTLPLGKPGLKETRTTQRVAPGVSYTRIVRGEQSKKDFYTVDVAFTATQSSADSVAAQLQFDGYKPWIQAISERAPDDPQSGPLGYLVRTGTFATEAKANALRDQLATDGYTALRSSTQVKTVARRPALGSCTCSR